MFDDPFTKRLDHLMQRLRSQKERAEQRLEAARQQLIGLDEKLRALELARDFHAEEMGIPKAERALADPHIARDYSGKTVRQMLQLWGNEHGGLIKVRDMVRALTAAGLFQTETQANGAIYPTLGRIKDVKKETPGRYRLIQNGEPNLNGSPIRGRIPRLRDPRSHAT